MQTELYKLRVSNDYDFWGSQIWFSWLKQEFASCWVRGTSMKTFNTNALVKKFNSLESLIKDAGYAGTGCIEQQFINKTKQ